MCVPVRALPACLLPAMLYVLSHGPLAIHASGHVLRALFRESRTALCDVRAVGSKDVQRVASSECTGMCGWEARHVMRPNWPRAHPETARPSGALRFVWLAPTPCRPACCSLPPSLTWCHSTATIVHCSIGRARPVVCWDSHRRASPVERLTPLHLPNSPSAPKRPAGRSAPQAKATSDGPPRRVSPGSESHVEFITPVVSRAWLCLGLFWPLSYPVSPRQTQGTLHCRITRRKAKERQ